MLKCKCGFTNKLTMVIMMKTNKKTDNKLILKRRKFKLFKKLSIFFVLLIAVLITLCFKLPYFKVTKIVVRNNKINSSESIIKLSGINLGSNIFYLNLRRAKSNIVSNPYLTDVDVERILPNTILINVTEREAYFYIKSGNNYIVIDNHGIVLEKRNDITGMKLIEVKGFDVNNVQINRTVSKSSEDDIKVQALCTLSDLIERNISGYQITLIDLSNPLSLNVYFKNMCIRLGTKENLENKLNKAINVMVANQLKDLKGYVDVSYEGSPVFFVEK